MPGRATPVDRAPATGSPWEVFRVFLRLGLTSFGGPIAHLGYFRTEFVERRRWLDDREYADLVALCQFLPGPASSQVGFAVGLRRAGFGGALLAFLGFTVPSAAIMIAVAAGATAITGPIATAVIDGLKIVAVAIVAQAVWAMARTLTPDRTRAGIALVSLIIALAANGSIAQLGAIVLGALAGWWLCRSREEPAALPTRVRIARPLAWTSLGVWAAVVVLTPAAAVLIGSGSLQLFAAFVRAGALVFGGGHVVLPLLDAGIVAPGWVTEAQVLAGYGAAQAVPGPLFTFAGYLGFVSTTGPGGIAGAVIALVGIFAPGFLLLVGVLPFWDAVRRLTWAQGMLRGANAAVVGILAAALYSPVFTGSVSNAAGFALAAVCFVLLVVFRVPPWAVVIIGAAGGLVVAVF